MNRDFKGVWIPKEVWLDETLTWMEKLLLTEVNSLDGEDGCFASNAYLAEFFMLSPSRISHLVKSLIDKKYVSAEYEREGKQVKKRVLRILNRGIAYSKEGIADTQQGYCENSKGINTLNNNTINNKSKTADLKRSVLDSWNELVSFKNHAYDVANRGLKKKHLDIVKSLGIEKLREAMVLYNEITTEPQYWWSHKYSLWDFIARKVDDFLPEEDPRESFIKGVLPKGGAEKRSPGVVNFKTSPDVWAK